MKTPDRKQWSAMLTAAFLVFALVVDLKAATYRSPWAVAVSPDGGALHVSDATAGKAVLLDPTKGEVRAEIDLSGEPRGVALSPDGKRLFVALRKEDAVGVIDAAAGRVISRIPAGAWPVALAVNGERLLCCNSGDHTVSVVDLKQGREVGRIPVTRQPSSVAITPDGTRAVVCNFLPKGVGTDRNLGAEVDLVDPVALRRVTRVALPPGSTMAGGAWVGPQGRWGYVVHILGRPFFPVTQLERGWVHAHALSIIDLAAGTRRATVLLDSLTQGAADPWAVTGSRDGRVLWISHRGAHEVSRVDIGRIHDLLSGNIPPEIAEIREGARENIWMRLKRDPSRVAELEEDLTALHLAGAIRRFASGGLGPCGIALSPDETRLYVANRFSGTVGALDARTGALARTISIGTQPEPDAVRRGEIWFHDATRCYQRWHSCASCHLDGGRIDGLPWDFLRDGIDNGKDVISLVGLPHTAPYSWRATRSSARECVATGVQGSHKVEADDSEVEDLLAYLGSLRPEPNPMRSRLAAAAARGQGLFEGRGGCAACHIPPWFTDGKTHDVGVRNANEPEALYNTPSLVESWRTAPYFHDGRAATMLDALNMPEARELHGNLKEMTASEIKDLAAYVLSL